MTDNKTPMEPQEARRILENVPAFIRDDLNQEGTMYNPRTKKYLVQYPNTVTLQLEKDSEEHFISTMPQHSSFYGECIYLSDLKKIAGTP